MSRLLVIIFVVIAFFTCSLATDYQVTYTKIDNATAEVVLTIEKYGIEKVTADNTAYSQIQFSSSVHTQKKGFASLPLLARSIRIPDMKNVDVMINFSDYEDIQLQYPLLPSKGVLYRHQNPADTPLNIDPNSITDSWYPGQPLVRPSTPFIVKDVRGIRLAFYPFQYNARKQLLRVYKTIDVIVTENSTPADNPLEHPSRILPEMDNLYASLFLNYTSQATALTYGQHGDILVITTARDETAIQPYIDWKREKGFNVEKEVVAAGTNPKDLIKQYYDANNNLLYVQIVGDWEDIPCDLGTSSNLPMDPVLGCVAGDDDYADIAVGRLSAASPSDVTTQVNKIITYEKLPQAAAGWYSTATGVASDQGPGDDNEYDYEHLEVIRRDKLEPFTYTSYNDIYDPGATSSMVSSAVNSGTGIINYTGHGSATSWSTSGFSNSDVNNLNNGDKLPVIFSVACNNGEFNLSGDCFAEAWLKKEGGGAVTMLASTISQPWDPPMRGQDYFNDLIVGGYNYDAHPDQNGISTSEGRSFFGSAIINGFALMLNESNSGSDVETVQTWTTFGDPALQFRTTAPAQIALSNQTVLAGQPFNTRVTAGEPVEGAMVCLSQNGLYAAGLTDANGEVNIDHPFNSGSVLLVVTGFNTETVYDTVPVQQADGPIIVVDHYTVNDTTFGNANGRADYSEQVLLNIFAENSGNQPAYGVEATLTGTDAWLTITDDFHTFGDMDSGQVVCGKDAFALTVADDVPDQHSASLTVEFKDVDDQAWNSDIELILNAPLLVAGELTVDDQAGGNGNGRLDPGENSDLRIATSNSGHAAAVQTTGQLSTSSPWLSLNNNTYNFGTIDPDQTHEAVFNVTVDAATPDGETATLYYTAMSGAYSVKDTFVVSIGNLQTFLMSDTTVNVSNGLFYDSGGEDANYQTREEYTMTFLPEERSPAVQVNFLSFSTTANYDNLYIYDGTSRTAPQVAGSPFSGNTLPGEIVATNPQGALTFYFKSNPILSDAGWKAEIFSTTISDIESQEGRRPLSFELLPNYPNPFNPQTTLRYRIAQDEQVSMKLFDAAGNLVRTIIKEYQPAGNHSLLLDGRDLASGVYFVRLDAGRQSRVRKILLLK